jgi:hypothetical protein
MNREDGDDVRIVQDPVDIHDEFRIAVGGARLRYVSSYVVLVTLVYHTCSQN